MKSSKKSNASISKVIGQIGICAALVSTLSPVWAQQLEEIIVTTEKRSQNLQTVAISVTSLSGDLVKEGVITQLSDVAQYTPNLTLGTFNIGEPQIFLRGIGSTEDSAGSDPGVAIFIDEVPIGRPGASSFDLYDLDRIEVLRGPQGTLYGKNVIGGAISFYTKKPQQEFEAKSGITVGDYGLTVLKGYVNGGISDTVAGKLSVSKRDRDGYSSNIKTGQDHDDANNFSLRGQLLFTPSDATEILLGVDYSKDDTNGQCRKNRGFDSAGQPSGGVFVAATLSALITDDPRVCEHSVIQSAEKEISGAMLRVDHDMDWATLTSITAYRESDLNWIQDLGGFDVPPSLVKVTDSAIESSNQISQELRLSHNGERLNWVAGLFALQEEVDRDERFQTAVVFAPIIGGDVSFMQSNETKSLAVFGQATYALTDAFGIILGGRWTKDEKTIDQSAINNLPSDPLPGLPLNAPPFSVTGANDSWSEFTPRLSLDWQVSDDKLLYFTASRGYKSGLFPSQQSTALRASTSLKPEVATNLELGAKTQWWDDRLRLNLAVFNLDYEDLQVFRLVDIALVVENLNTTIKGAEFEYAWAMTDQFSINGSYSYLDAEYESGTSVLAGNRLSRTPSHQSNVTANYSLPFSNGGEMDFRLTWSHVGNYYFDAANNPRSLQASHEVVDASIVYVPASDKWDLTLWAKNLDDELYAKHSILGVTAGAVELQAAPRTYGMTLNYRW